MKRIIRQPPRNVNCSIIRALSGLRFCSGGLQTRFCVPDDLPGPPAVAFEFPSEGSRRTAGPVNKTSKPRPAERDYSHRLLIDKLGVKRGQRIAVLGVESAEFLKNLAARAPDYSRGKPIAGADLIFLSAEAITDLTNLKSLARSLPQNGAIWVVYPKGQTHIREIDVITAGKSAGLTDNKVCGFSATHTALRFCIPRANR